MDRYYDLEILPDPEFPVHQLMDALFAKLHRCLVHTGITTVGVSFPRVDEQRPSLGGVLRLHGREADLTALMAEPWLVGMRDHIHAKGIATVPGGSQLRQVRRVQAKSSPERLRRRQMRRHGLTEEEARARVPDHVRETLRLPFLSVGSQTTGQRFRLFLEHREASAPVSGTFNAYGLSATATVPWF